MHCSRWILLYDGSTEDIEVITKVSKCLFYIVCGYGPLTSMGVICKGALKLLLRSCGSPVSLNPSSQLLNGLQLKPPGRVYFPCLLVKVITQSMEDNYTRFKVTYQYCGGCMALSFLQVHPFSFL
jgi:hypothetical protein